MRIPAHPTTQTDPEAARSADRTPGHTEQGSPESAAGTAPDDAHGPLTTNNSELPRHRRHPAPARRAARTVPTPPPARLKATRPPTKSRPQPPVRHYRSMPAPAAAPRWPIDLTGNPAEIVGSTEAARVIGHPRPNRLPLGLLEIADEIEYHDDGTVKRRGWKRETLWRYATTVMASHSTTIDGKLAVDRAGAADRLGTHLSRVDAFIAAAPDNGFPEAVEDRWYYTDAIDAFADAKQQRQHDNLTKIDYTGDPDDLVTKAEAARIAGYSSPTNLNNSSLLDTLLALNKPEHNSTMPNGRPRLRWPRRTVWYACEQRTGRPGRPAGATRTIDRSGDPDELVDATEATRILGYKRTASLPRKLLEQPDEPGPPRRWRRATLWATTPRSTTA